MGGHGGLNILPQKRWNVYNFDNREKVRKDEEEAAKEEQLKREQSRKRDTEFRIEQLRQARGLASSSRQGTTTKAAESPEPEEKDTEPKSKHINLFEGIRIFDPVDNKNNNNKRESLAGRGETSDNKRIKKEEPKVVSAEDEKYRLGYGVAGKGVKLPWYLMEKQQQPAAHHNDSSSDTTRVTSSSKKKKMSVAELREERLKREAREKARQQALFLKHPHRTR